ncbi:MAG: DUF7544 domain-containing protein [Planctomycetota bacterium]|jgi:hypothetical protein
MTPEQLSTISVIEPISQAIEKTKTLLFKPFDLEKWFTIGFCAWLALLGQGGFNFHFPTGNFQRPGFPSGQVNNFLSENLPLIILIGSIGLVIGLAITITLLWLSSRGRFMFLYCISQNKAEVKIPWHKFRRHGNSLFLFKVVTGFIAFIISGLCAAMIIPMIISLDKNHGGISASQIFAIVGVSFVTSLVAITFMLFFKLTNDFVIPIMYLNNCNCTKAWHRFLEILSSRKGAFTLYMLFQAVIAIAIGIIVMMLIFGTCCCAACFLAIPYIGTVLVLPLLVFKRAYSLCYLRQFGPRFDVFICQVTMPESDTPQNDPLL